MRNMFVRRNKQGGDRMTGTADTDVTTSGVFYCLSALSQPQSIEQSLESQSKTLSPQKWQTAHNEVTVQTTTPSSYIETHRKSPKRMVKIRSKLPKRVGPFGSNHLLINKERLLRGVKPLVREKNLDEIAVEHAKYMAAEDKLQHSPVLETTTKILTRTSLPKVQIIGENVCCSDKRGRHKKATLEAYQKQFAASVADRKNILNEKFWYFGVGTARSDSGVIYICQLFGG